MKQVTAKQVKIEGLSSTEQSLLFSLLNKAGKIKIVGKQAQPKGKRGKPSNIFEVPDTIKIPVQVLETV